MQYNLSVAAIAVDFMQSARDTVVDHDDEGDYPQEDWVKYVLMGAVFVGAVVGMAGMGYVGDVVGRRAGMVLTQALAVAGALGSAVLPWGGAVPTYALLAACRFVLGVGVGGVYPMSAAAAAESAASEEDAGDRVGRSYFWQAS